MEGPRLVPKWAFALCLSLHRQEGPNQPQGIARRPADRFRMRARFAQRQVIAHG